MILTQSTPDIINLSLHLVELKLLALAIDYALTDDSPGCQPVEKYALRKCLESGITLSEEDIRGIITAINVIMRQRGEQIVGSSYAALKAANTGNTLQ